MGATLAPEALWTLHQGVPYHRCRISLQIVILQGIEEVGHIQRIRQMMERNKVHCVQWCDTRDMTLLTDIPNVV